MSEQIQVSVGAYAISNQQERTRQMLESHFGKLVEAGMTPDEVGIWLETESAWITASYYKDEDENGADH